MLRIAFLQTKDGQENLNKKVKDGRDGSGALSEKEKAELKLKRTRDQFTSLKMVPPLLRSLLRLICTKSASRMFGVKLDFKNTFLSEKMQKEGETE